RAGQKREAQDLTARAQAAAEEVDVPKLREAALNKVRKVLSGFGSLDEALTATMKIADVPERWSALRDLSLKLLVAKRVDLTKEAAQGALDAAREQKVILQGHSQILPWAVQVLPQ